MVDSQNFLIVIYIPIQTLEILSVCTENKQKFMAPYPSGSTSGAFHSLILGSVGAIALEISDWTPGTFYILIHFQYLWMVFLYLFTCFGECIFIYVNKDILNGGENWFYHPQIAYLPLF